MDRDEFDVNVLAEHLIPVLADADGCRAYRYWRTTFGHISDDQHCLYVSGQYETINDATLMFSLMSLRKIDEFLSDNKKSHANDIRYSDFGICKDNILIDCESLLPRNVRTSINRTIVHFTNIGQPGVEDWEKFQEVLEAAEPTLKRLENVIKRMLNISIETKSLKY